MATSPQPSTAPGKLTNALDRRIVGQHIAKEALVSAVLWNQRRAKLVLNAGIDEALLPPKQNVLLIGPSGSAKTTLAQRLAAESDLPFLSVQATAFSSSGYVGDSVEEIPGKLLRAAKGNLEQAMRGIVFLDEFDKLRRRGFQSDVGCLAVQQALLGLLEGSTHFFVGAGGPRFDLSHITFIAAGVFFGIEKVATGLSEDFSYRDITKDHIVDYGFLPEVLGRFRLAALEKVSETELRTLLTKGESSIVQRLKNVFAIHGIDLEFDDGAIDELVRRGQVGQVGIRGVNELCVEILGPALAQLREINADGITRIVVDRSAVQKKTPPWHVPGTPRPPSVNLLLPEEDEAAIPLPDMRQTEDKLRTLKAAVKYSEARPAERESWDTWEKSMFAKGRTSDVLSLLTAIRSRRATLSEFYAARIVASSNDCERILEVLDQNRKPA